MTHRLADSLLTHTLAIIFLATVAFDSHAQIVGEAVFYHSDLVGSPVAMTDSDGDLLWTVDRYPYGEEYQPDSESLSEKVGYTGHVLDRDTALVYMQARYYDPLVGRFYGIDARGAIAESPESFNRYAYAANNPYTLRDPDGEIFETGWDVLNVGIGLVSLSGNLATGNYLGAALDATGVLIDMAAAVVPGVPAGAGTALRSARAVDGAGGFVTKNGARGRASEARVLNDLGLPKNTQKVSTSEGNAIPDALTSRKSVEIKDCISVSCTRQIRIQTGAAKASGRESVLVTGTKTHVSKPAERAFDRIIRRDDLGPK